MDNQAPSGPHSWVSAYCSITVYREGERVYTVYKVVDISSLYAIMYIQYKERSRHMVSRLSRGIIISIVSLSTLQGCSSLSTHSQDGIIDGIMKGFSTSRYPGQRPWDPPVEVGYGARIPNMQGDWDRFCGEDRGERSACR